MNERRERENKWEDWAGLEQEIDELGSAIERAIHSSLKLYPSLLSGPRLLPRARLAEVPLAGHLTRFGLSIPGLEQLVVHAFAQALLEPVRVLAQNQGGVKGPASAFPV
ncbi:T-complex protein 1 subunit theta-like [Tachysurus ichikawai]